MVLIRAETSQAALDAWVRGAALPLRLRLRADGLAVRAGLRGIRLAEVRATDAIHDRLLVVTPHRGAVLGVVSRPHGWGSRCPSRDCRAARVRRASRSERATHPSHRSEEHTSELKPLMRTSS